MPVFRTVLRYLLVLSAAFNSAKLLFYWAQGASMEGESFRVFHNEVDVICASLGLIAVIALPEIVMSMIPPTVTGAKLNITVSSSTIDTEIANPA